MLIVFQFFRAAAAIALHPGEALSAGGDTVADRRAELNAVVQFALEALRGNSPVGTADDQHPGLYRDSHTLFINGNDVANLSSWRPGDTIHISNSVPYARLIEVGDSHMRVPHHVYQLAEQATRAKYGAIASINLIFMPLNFARGQRSPAGSGRSSGRGGHDWFARQPALQIRGLD